MTSAILFWCYWLITLVIAILLLRELIRSREWTLHASVGLALLPFLLRVLLIK